MKHNRSEKRKSTDSDSDLAAMREAFQRHKERAKGGGSSKNDWDKLETGKNYRRVLPRPGERKFYTEGWTHFNVGPNGRAVRCVDEAHIDLDRGLPTSGTKCPICKKFLREQSRINSEYQKGDEDGRDEWKKAKDKYCPRHQYYVNVLIEEDDGAEVKILAFGPQVWGQLMNYYLGDDTDVGDFTDPESGRALNIKKESKGGRNRRNVEYHVYPADERTDISDAWPDIKEALHDLDGAAGKVLSVDEVKAIMSGIDPDRESADDDDDAGDDRSSRGRRPARRRDDDDDDASSDVGSGEDDDDDDEDDKPVRKSGSKLASKMKHSRRRDD